MFFQETKPQQYQLNMQLLLAAVDQV